jgi:hypothetical protein
MNGQNNISSKFGHEIRTPIAFSPHANLGWLVYLKKKITAACIYFF